MSNSKKIEILTQVLGTGQRQGSDEVYFRCPYCKHPGPPKLAVNLSRGFHCWRCDVRGRTYIASFESLVTIGRDSSILRL